MCAHVCAYMNMGAHVRTFVRMCKHECACVSISAHV